MKLLALVEQPGHVCCRYRIRAFEPALEEAGCSLCCEGLYRGAFFRSIQLHRAGQFDAVILQRKLLPNWQLKALRRAARRLVFDFDDAVMFRDSYSQRRGYSRSRTGRFARTVLRGRYNRRRERLPGRRGASSRSQRRAGSCDPDLRRPDGLSDRAAGGPSRACLDWLLEHSSGPRAVQTDLAGGGRGDSRPQAAGDLRSLPGVVSAAGHSGALGRADGGIARSRRGRSA